MKINVKEFIKFVNKSTVNYLIESFQLNYNKEKNTVWSRLRSPSMKIASIIELPNTILSGMVDDVQFNFNNPKENLKPYLNLFDIDEVSLKISDNKIVLNKQVKLHFSDPSIISTIQKRNLEEIDDFFVSINLNEDFFNIFDKIKKVGNKFERIYFTVKDNELFIESTDKSNAYSNGIKFKLCDLEFEDIVFGFNYQFFSKLMTVLTENFKLNISDLGDGTNYQFFSKLTTVLTENFKLEISDLGDGAGLLKCSNENEQYFLINEMD